MSYPGSKAQAGVWQRIIGQMPPHSVYVEPFFGSGRIYWLKKAARVNILIDKNVACRPELLMQHTVFRLGNALDFLAMFKDNQGTGIHTLPDDALIYCDPPYPMNTRAGRVYYEHEMSDDDHAALLSALKALKCRVMISTYPNELYGRELQNWRCCRYQTMTRGGKRTELLYCNFPEPDVLHDWRYAGRNFRERCALKRLEKRWLAKLEAMTPRKRGYVLNAIAQRQNGRGGPE